ncbi:hypothetical protein TSOC_008787 [Tetrabaena socialis]|uniref:Uncharacterized protein n=1 Tax=Tetrabaena socialis TaxID=47790 RepID=A0A2J7ZXJ0_9CHLO|nr:hypothetical protein TSOC_008787 [Tetrabaena socialis]|eukprot:PNH04984.1 hypothetical protein TSOC_008787 [Tetrabaena socialis]
MGADTTMEVVAGAVPLSRSVPSHTQKSNAQAAARRASKASVNGSSGLGSPQLRPLAEGPSRPKLVDGDYTYTTVRRNLVVSSQTVGRELFPGEAAALALSHTMPAMRPTSANTMNVAAWKAYGSPSARGMPRPVPPPTPSHANTNPQMFAGITSKPPRVMAFGGGYKLADRPQSAPMMAPGQDPSAWPAQSRSPPRAPLSPPRRPPLHATRSASAGSAAHPLLPSPSASATLLAVALPDPVGGGKTDGGTVMFEHTLPTDPLGLFLWEQQARKARANMVRHVAAMVAAAAINGGVVGGSGGGAAGSTSRPASARRAAAGSSSVLAAASAVGAAASAGGGPGMRPRFSSSSIAALQRQGPDTKPPTILGFSAPDLLGDSTLPGPGDPRWTYTRLGRTQLDRLQQALKMPESPAHRPTSAPVLVLGGGRAGGGGGDGGGVRSPERGSRVGREEAALAPVAEQPEEAAPGGGTAAGQLGRSGSGVASGEDSALASRHGSHLAPGVVGFRPGSAGAFRPGSAGAFRPGSAGAFRPGSAGAFRPGSAGGLPPAASSSRPASGSNRPSWVAVRGSSAGRSREAAPNPRVDLRAYLAEEGADAGAEGPEGEESGEEQLAVGWVGDGEGEGEGADAVQSVPVHPDALAARLAQVMEMQREGEEREEGEAWGGMGSPAASAFGDRADEPGGEGAEEAPAEPSGGQEGGVGGAAEAVQQEREQGGRAATERSGSWGWEAGAAADAAAPGPAAVVKESSGAGAAAPQGDEPGAAPPQPHAAKEAHGEGDALMALHGNSHFGSKAASRFSGGSDAYGEDAEEEEDEEESEGGDALSSLEHAPRTGSALRPASARPMSARPVARPGSAMPTRAAGGSRQGSGSMEPYGSAQMMMIQEQSESAAGEEYE